MVPQLQHCPHLPVDPPLPPAGPGLHEAQAGPGLRDLRRPVQAAPGPVHQSAQHGDVWRVHLQGKTQHKV